MPWCMEVDDFVRMVEPTQSQEPALSVAADGHRYDLFRVAGVGNHFIARVEDEPSPGVFHALSGALGVLGIDVDVVAMCLRSEDVASANARVVHGEPDRYARIVPSIVGKVRHQERRPAAESAIGLEQPGNRDHNLVGRLKSIVLGSDDQFAHHRLPTLHGLSPRYAVRAFLALRDQLHRRAGSRRPGVLTRPAAGDAWGGDHR